MRNSRHGLARPLAVVACAAALAGCAQVPTQEPSPGKAVFYPSLPVAPRIQHLVTYTGERDVKGPAGGFEKFVVGDAPTVQVLKQPYGVALFDGKIYVADSRAPGLAVFDLRQGAFRWMPGSGNGRMKRPINIKVDRDGTKYVTDTGRDQVLVFDRDDRFVAAFGSEKQFKPVDTAILGDRLYVVDIQHHVVQVLDKRSGAFLFQFGKAGSGTAELFQPTNIAIGSNGKVYVVDTGNFRVQEFGADGTHVRVYGEVGNTVGKFARPKGIALDRAGRLYIGDAAFENVQLFDAEGRLLLYFGQPGGEGNGLNLPTGVAIDYDNVDLFRRYAEPGFELEYVIVVASQFGPNKIDVFGFGKLRGMKYSAADTAGPRR